MPIRFEACLSRSQRRAPEHTRERYEDAQRAMQKGPAEYFLIGFEKLVCFVGDNEYASERGSMRDFMTGRLGKRQKAVLRAAVKAKTNL